MRNYTHNHHVTMHRSHEIIVTGGGSGGHISPTLSVATELKALQPDVKIRYVIDRGSTYKAMVVQHDAIDKVSSVFAGKFRRYHGVSVWRHITDIKTMLKNARDVIYFGIGFMQSLILLIMHRPSVIFIKGGFVGVPIGLAAALLRVPYITHDSDTVPGLANRIIARWAKKHAVGMPVGNYTYPRSKTIEVGVPIAEAHFAPVDAALQRRYRQELGISQDAVVLCVVGGGGGARVIDDLIEQIAPDILAKLPQLHIIHLFGKLNEHRIAEYYRQLNQEARARVHTVNFTTKLYQYSGAADVVITRAGATNMTEFAMQKKACIIIPAAHLTGGHQVKNATMYANANAALVLKESTIQQEPAILTDTLFNLLHDAPKRNLLATNLFSFATLDSAKKLATIILETSNEKA